MVVLAGWLVREKSKTNFVLLSMVLFYVAANFFCTDAVFAPMPSVPGMLEAGRLEGRQAGRQAGRLAGRYPPFDGICWDDRGF